MTQNEMTVLQGLEAGTTPELDELRRTDFIALSVAIGNLIDRGLLVEEDGEYFPTADGIRAIFA